MEQPFNGAGGVPWMAWLCMAPTALIFAGAVMLRAWQLWRSKRGEG